MNRRRFLTITAGMAALTALPTQAHTVRQWRGTALGSGATIALDHPQADRLIALARAEIARLEGVFSLYRADSALSRLNRDGQLAAPPFELLECLSLCDRVHAASGGLFDPTVQPVWAALAESWSQGRAPEGATLAAARQAVGWGKVQYDPGMVRFARPGMAMTLNGVAQGVIADRVADLLRGEGLADVLIDAGEIAARGHAPDSAGWPVGIAGGPRLVLSDRALATSAPRGTVFDAAGQVGHILHPGTGPVAQPALRQVSISAPRAGLADALSTTACLLPDPGAVARLTAAFAGAQVESVLTATAA